MLARLLARYSIVWFLCHTILVLLGFLVANLTSFRTWWGADIAVGAGASLIAAGITGIITYLHITLVEKSRGDYQSVFEAGVLKIFDARATRIKDEYDRRIKNAKELDILGFGLSALRQDYIKEFEQWSQRSRVRIILIDPDFPDESRSFADLRDREERNSPNQIRNDVTAFLREVSQLKKLVRRQFQIRKLRSIPAINIFRIDDELFFGPYLIGHASRNAPTFLVRKGGFLYDRFRSHFEELWKSEEFSTPAVT